MPQCLGGGLLIEPILRLNSCYLTCLTIVIESHYSHSTFRHLVITLLYGCTCSHKMAWWCPWCSDVCKLGTEPHADICLPCRVKILVLVFIIGNPAYYIHRCNTQWEYAGGGTNSQEHYFGYRLCSARNVWVCFEGQRQGLVVLKKWWISIYLIYPSII